MQALDPDLLKTFLAFVDSGSLAQAASSVGRSPSAVTAQMQRLEEIVGEPLLAPQGRGRGLLRAFAASHPRVRIELRVGRSTELAQALQSGGLDLAIVMRQAATADEVGVLREPMIWLCSQKGLATRQEELPLALLDPYCGFREAALAALDAAGRRYRIAAGSASLAGLRTAVNAGVALTLRTARFAHSGIVEAPRELGLPQVPMAEFAIRLRAGADGSAADLATLLSGNLALSLG